MRVLGIPEDKIGAGDPWVGKPWRAFNTDEKAGGRVSTLIVDSGSSQTDPNRSRSG
jgi:hypothetical protein